MIDMKHRRWTLADKIVGILMLVVGASVVLAVLSLAGCARCPPPASKPAPRACLKPGLLCGANWIGEGDAVPPDRFVACPSEACDR